MGLLKQGNTYLLQLRNGKKQAGGLGLIGCFGGQIEADEDALTAVCREVAEESSFAPHKSQAQYFGEVNVTSERHDQPITVHAKIYLFELDSSVKVAAKEGELVTMTADELRTSYARLTPAMKSCFDELIIERRQ